MWILELNHDFLLYNYRGGRQRSFTSSSPSSSSSEMKCSLKTNKPRKKVLMSYNCSMFWLFKWKLYMLDMFYSLVHAFNLIWHLTLNSLTCAQSSLNQVAIKAVNVCLFCSHSFQKGFYWCAVSPFDLMLASEVSPILHYPKFEFAHLN